MSRRDEKRQLEILLRNQPDTLIVWTCITGIEVRVGKSNTLGATEKKTWQENEDDNEEQAENDSDKSESDDSEIKPGISFWIVVDVPQHSLKDMEKKVIQVMLTSGLEIENCRPIQARNGDNTASYYTATLCQALKDHKSYYAEQLAIEMEHSNIRHLTFMFQLERESRIMR